ILSLLPSSLPLSCSHSFPTRRSSDLGRNSQRCAPNNRIAVGRNRFDVYDGGHGIGAKTRRVDHRNSAAQREPDLPRGILHYRAIDRKSTRLNSSHQIISYAVFFLKKK